MHRRGKWVGAAALAGLLVSQAAWAADTAPSLKGDIEPPNGLPFKFRMGFYTEVQLGFFTVFGGGGAEKGVSNGQAYEALSVGYEFGSIPAVKLSIFLTAAHGANAGSCRLYSPTAYPTSTNGCEIYSLGDAGNSMVTAPENFSTFPIELGVRLGFKEFLPRMFPYAVATFGYTIMTPQVYFGAPAGSLHFGVGGGVQYGTRLDGLSVGLEVLFRYAFSPTLPSLAIYPRVAYVF